MVSNIVGTLLILLSKVMLLCKLNCNNYMYLYENKVVIGSLKYGCSYFVWNKKIVNFLNNFLYLISMFL